jgi:hypothetical protein
MKTSEADYGLPMVCLTWPEAPGATKESPRLNLLDPIDRYLRRIRPSPIPRALIKLDYGEVPGGNSGQLTADDIDRLRGILRECARKLTGGRRTQVGRTECGYMRIVVRS